VQTKQGINEDNSKTEL